MNKMIQRRVVKFDTKEQFNVSFFDDDTIDVVRQQIGISTDIHPNRLLIFAKVKLSKDYYEQDLITILSIVLYEKDILNNEELLLQKLNKLTELYNLPKLSFSDIQKKIREIKLGDFEIRVFKNHLKNYFKSGIDDEFRNWIKILTDEMRKYKSTSIEDLVKLKYENNENNNN